MVRIPCCVTLLWRSKGFDEEHIRCCQRVISEAQLALLSALFYGGASTCTLGACHGSAELTSVNRKVVRIPLLSDVVPMKLPECFPSLASLGMTSGAFEFGGGLASHSGDDVAAQKLQAGRTPTWHLVRLLANES